MTFTKDEEIIILKSLHRIMARLNVKDLPLFWDVVRAIEGRGGNIKGRDGNTKEDEENIK